MRPYLELNKAPEGATHCVNPDSVCDPLFYRMFEGELQIWGIAINKWLVSKHEPGFIQCMDRLPLPEVEIVPCPFCGKAASPNNNWREVWVDCDTCGSKGPVFSRNDVNYFNAIKAWNRRVIRKDN